MTCSLTSKWKIELKKNTLARNLGISKRYTFARNLAAARWSNAFLTWMFWTVKSKTCLWIGNSCYFSVTFQTTSGTIIAKMVMTSRCHKTNTSKLWHLKASTLSLYLVSTKSKKNNKAPCWEYHSHMVSARCLHWHYAQSSRHNHQVSKNNVWTAHSLL